MTLNRNPGFVAAQERQRQERQRLDVLVVLNAHDFAPEFRSWLHANLHVWQAFVHEAMKVRAVGHDHYSARTIVEVLRHQSAIREVGGPWKIDNDRVPDMARLWGLRYPSMAAMFAFRKRPLRAEPVRGFPMSEMAATSPRRTGMQPALGMGYGDDLAVA
jgi:hypothetical protein